MASPFNSILRNNSATSAKRSRHDGSKALLEVEHCRGGNLRSLTIASTLLVKTPHWKAYDWMKSWSSIGPSIAINPLYSGPHATLKTSTSARLRVHASLITKGPPKERDTWRRLFESPVTESDARAWLPSFNADLASGDDKLGMSPDIEAMASLIVSKSLQPPLSIGLFWKLGFGEKLFFHAQAPGKNPGAFAQHRSG